MSWMTAIARRLPAAQRQAAARLYERINPPAWTYNADGLATTHHCPFTDDPGFAGTYALAAPTWGADLRWRMWILTRYAQQALSAPGDYAEFGSYRGGCALMIAAAVNDPGRTLHLFDTFAGIPDTNLTTTERHDGMSGRLADTSQHRVRELLAPWSETIELHPGDVFDTVPADIGPLAFAHIDLNAAAPTVHALTDTYSRLSPGGVIVFDDYGWEGYEDQRAAIDEFLTGKPEVLIAMPTGQAVLTRTPQP